MMISDMSPYENLRCSVSNTIDWRRAVIAADSLGLKRNFRAGDWSHFSLKGARRRRVDYDDDDYSQR